MPTTRSLPLARTTAPRLLPALLLPALLAIGCGRGTDRHHPRSALDAYAKAVRANDPRAAYNLLSKKLRQEMSFQVFAKRWQKNYDELKLQAEAIGQSRAKPAAFDVKATIRIGTKRTVTLGMEKDRWRILGGVGEGFDSASPREAIQGLVRALESKNFSAFLKLLSKSRREQFEREMTLRLEKLKANLDRDVEVTGNQARFQYDPRFWIRLVKENGVWKIVEFN